MALCQTRTGVTETALLAQMEATLIAIAEADIDITPALYERFFATFPEQRSAFTNLDAASGRMANETIEALIGLASGESWVPVTITNFVDLHRNYGDIPVSQYTAFVDMIVAALADAAGAKWNDLQEHAWQAQADRLNKMIAEACEGRTPTLPA